MTFALAGWAIFEALLVWAAHENHLPFGSLAPGLGLLLGAIAVARAAGWKRLPSAAAALLVLLGWLGLSSSLFAQRDRALRTVWLDRLRSESRAPAATGPSFVVVVADALRRDHLSLYGYSRETSPHLARFAADAAVFERAFAQAPSTKPAIASLFTSRFPSQHRAIDNEDALDASLPTLAEALRGAGYRTAAFVENPIIGAEFGYQRGFDFWALDDRRHDTARRSPGAGMQDVDGAIEIWLRHNRHRPFFLYVHYLDPHSPYAAPARFAGRFGGKAESAEETRHVGDAARGDEADARARYDEEILYVDARFGRLVAKLRALGLLDATATVFLSDHGEGFGEHGYVHHSRSVYSDLIDVPLVIRYPARFASGRTRRLTQHIDLAPTIAELAGLDATPLGFEGRSLLAPLPDDASVVVEHLRAGWGRRQRAVIEGGFKLVHDLEGDRFELFHVEADPADRADLLAAADREIVAKLERRLAAHVARAGLERAPRVEIPDETLRSLKALGYVR